MQGSSGRRPEQQRDQARSSTPCGLYVRAATAPLNASVDWRADPYEMSGRSVTPRRQATRRTLSRARRRLVRLGSALVVHHVQLVHCHFDLRPTLGAASARRAFASPCSWHEFTVVPVPALGVRNREPTGHPCCPPSRGACTGRPLDKAPFLSPANPDIYFILRFDTLRGVTIDLEAFGAKIAMLGEIFKPAAPTDDQRLFRGRRVQLSRLLTVASAPGQHAIIFGERGVGKTSVSYMVRDAYLAIAPQATVCVRLACTAEDDFESLWRKLPGRLTREVGRSTSRHLKELLSSETIDAVEDAFLDDPTPDSVAQVLAMLSDRARMMVIVDELDRMDVFAAGAKLADLVKQISDDIVPCTLILVGVADNVSDLIAGHASVDRCLIPISMPRMTHAELSEIVDEGFAAYGDRSGSPISITSNSSAAIASLSQGFPYYTHLLASAVGRTAIADGRDAIEFTDVFDALMAAKDEAEPSIREAYYNATLAARSDATFEETLIACALASPDRMGYFTASDVCDPLSYILQIPRKNADFNAHLRRFSTSSPIVLDAKTSTNTPRYRFSNPLMKPYAMMCGLSSGILKREFLQRIK